MQEALTANCRAADEARAALERARREQAEQARGEQGEAEVAELRRQLDELKEAMRSQAHAASVGALADAERRRLEAAVAAQAEETRRVREQMDSGRASPPAG